MDIEMKVQILRACSSKKGNRCSSCPAFGHGDRNCIRNAMKDAATALTALLAENKKLRAEVEMWKCRCKEAVNHASELDIALYDTEAKLEQVKHQRDSYRLYHDDLASKPNCNTCADKDCKYRPIPGDTVRANCPLWRGPQKED